MLSLKDLCTLDLIPDMVEAGVYSMKIEGRMKSPRYTAGVVSVYRKYVDRYLERGREGYAVDPADRRLSWTSLTGEDFPTDITGSTMGGTWWRSGKTCLPGGKSGPV